VASPPSALAGIGHRMEHPAPLAVLTLLLSACTCSAQGRDAVDIHADDGPIAAAPLPASPSYCAEACKAAGEIGCQSMFTRLCRDDAASFVRVGGYALRCGDALRSACAGAKVGVPACVSSCTAAREAALDAPTVSAPALAPEPRAPAR
jgi:hypothetical protein